MSKKDDLLQAFQNNLNKWVCGYCNSGSNQPAAIFREIKKLGYDFEEHRPNRWGKQIYCDHCQNQRTHYKLRKPDPFFMPKPRINMSIYDRDRIIRIHNNKDAFTGASISSTPEIDHKVPWRRLNEDIDSAKLNEEEIERHFQLLTREHNALKDRQCRSCKINNKRPPFLEISFWFDGGENYDGTCNGCGWHDGKKWREELNRRIG